MRTPVRIKKWDSQPRYKFTANYRQGGKRMVRYFADEKSAKAFAAEKTIELLNEGRRNGELSGEERRAVLVAREKDSVSRTRSNIMPRIWGHSTNL